MYYTQKVSPSLVSFTRQYNNFRYYMSFTIFPVSKVSTLEVSTSIPTHHQMDFENLPLNQMEHCNFHETKGVHM